MDARQLFSAALHSATDMIQRIEDADMDRPSPNPGWDVRRLAGHMLSELRWMPDLLNGRSIAEVGAAHDDLPATADALHAAWQAAVLAAEPIIADVDLEVAVALSYGEVAAADYIEEAACDQLIHAWDAATALAVPVRFDVDVLRAVHEVTEPKLAHMGESGLFAEPLEVADDADMQTRVLAMYGRDASLNKA